MGGRRAQVALANGRLRRDRDRVGGVSSLVLMSVILSCMRRRRRRRRIAPVSVHLRRVAHGSVVRLERHVRVRPVAV